MKREPKPKKSKGLFLARQGDVLIMEVDEENFKPGKEVERDPDGALVLARGEVTGHRHRIVQRQAGMYDGGGGVGGTAFCLKTEIPCVLQHEEHGSINLPAGRFNIRLQREYHPEELRNVAD